MPDIRLHRTHGLGLPRARELAAEWVAQAEQKFDMVCTLTPGDDSDAVDFQRSGVKGRLTVAADHFDLQAKLGFLLGAFSQKIEREIERNLDELLGNRDALPPTSPDTSVKD
jgi:putative polyhydroxyalkanoate system protein